MVGHARLACVGAGHCIRGWAAVTWKCHSALQAWTLANGVTWSVIITCCYLGVAWRYLVFLFWSVLFVIPKYPRFGKINFHLEMLPGPTHVVVTCLPGPPFALDESLGESWAGTSASPDSIKHRARQITKLCR